MTIGSPIYRHITCLHALCNAHHLRELERAYEQDNQQWARQMQTLLQDILADVKAQGNVLLAEQAEHYAERYRALLKQAENECSAPDETKKTGSTRAG